MKKFVTLSLLLLAVCTLNAQVLLEENFEGGSIPSGWTQQTDASDGGWKVGTASALSSLSFPIPDNSSKVAATNDDGCDCNKLADYLILPPLDFSAVTVPKLKFDVFYVEGTWEGATENGSIEASTDAGVTWTVVDDLTGEAAWRNNYIVDLSAFAGNAQVWVAFHYTDGGGWLFGYAIDNVSVFQPSAHDVAVSKLTNPRFKAFGTGVDITGEITNEGLETLTSFDLNWSDGVNTYTDNITGIDVPYLGTYSFTHSTALTLAQAVTYDFSVWADNPNGAADGNAGNNSLDGVVSGVTYVPAKKMFVEEGTGTWCGYCPRGSEWMDWMAEYYPEEFVGVAVHNDDPMEVVEYDQGVSALIPGYPAVVVDRVGIWDPSDLETILPEYLSHISPVAPTVDASIDVATRKLTVNAAAEFVTQLENLDYRINVILSEDGVTGTGSGFNQVNYYSGDSDPIPDYGVNYEEASDPVPASEMIYNHVGRALLGGWAGTAGSVPASVTAGDMATKEYTVSNFNTDWNPFNMHAVIAIIDNATGEVLNVNSAEIDVVCPTDFDVTADVTLPSFGGGGNDGEIEMTLANPNFGFGGYTFIWSNGDSGASIGDLVPGDYTVTVSDKIGCEQTVEVSITTNAVTDIEALAGMSLTPNPASDLSQLNANFTEAVDVHVQVLNAQGQVMNTVSFDRTKVVQHTFNLGDYAAGTYLIKMTVGAQIHTERLIVTK